MTFIITVFTELNYVKRVDAIY